MELKQSKSGWYIADGNGERLTDDFATERIAWNVLQAIRSAANVKEPTVTMLYNKEDLLDLHFAISVAQLSFEKYPERRTEPEIKKMDRLRILKKRIIDQALRLETMG